MRPSHKIHVSRDNLLKNSPGLDPLWATILAIMDYLDQDYEHHQKVVEEMKEKLVPLD